MTSQTHEPLRELWKLIATGSELTEEWRQRLEGSASVRTYKLGDIICESGGVPSEAFFILKGSLREIYQEPGGRQRSVYRYEKGYFCNWSSMLAGLRHFRWIASSDVEVLCIKRTFVFELAISQQFNSYISQCQADELINIASNPIHRMSDDLEAVIRKVRSGIDVDMLILQQGEKLASSGDWILSSSIYPGKKSGTIINAQKEDIVNQSRIPLRLISRSSFEKLFSQDRERESEVSLRIESQADIDVENESIAGSNLSLLKEELSQQEALNDWYGLAQRPAEIPVITGKNDGECFLAVLRMIARWYQIPYRKDVLTKIVVDKLTQSGPTSDRLLFLASLFDLMGLSVSSSSLETATFGRQRVPFILLYQNRPIVVCNVDSSRITVIDPRLGKQVVSIESLFNTISSEGAKILLLSRARTSAKKRFGLNWFIPAIKKHRRILIEVLIASLMVQLFQLFNPLLIQKIIDAVISQGNLKSLNVYGGLLIAMALAEGIIGTVRTYLFSDTTNRIDVGLGSTIIDHLLRLPLSYFAKRPVGEVSTRVNELQKIRSFLTGTALTVLLDALFGVIYIAVMLMYSVTLTIWALAVLPIFIGLTALSAPVIRQQLREQAEHNAKVQSHLVETLSGMETVKGQGIEMQGRWRWQRLYGQQIKSGFKNVITRTAAGSASNTFQQLSSLLVLWVGAGMVLNGELTLGGLIAFRIIAGYVTSPMLRLATLWQNFQETGLSLERLGDIIDAPQEIEIAGEGLPPLPPVQGSIEYQNVDFRFNPQSELQLKNVTFSIPAGKFVGIVGSSGSGKSTALKLLTRLYDPERGYIKVDDYDISKVDLYSLRRQIGVVPQDSLLFDGSIQENISLTKPDATFEEVVDACRIACAHDFVMSLPSGYASSVGERGSALSGGQRQRLAIARTILRKPNLLILDEATSALDADTEKNVTANLMEQLKGKTVLFITHRLGSLRNADCILVMDHGALVEQGSHDELMKLNGRYAVLYKQQEGIPA